MPHPDWLETVHIRFPSGRSADFPVVENAAGLAWIANLGCIELHTWHSRVTDVERPDYLLIDLDPSEGNPWEFVREIAMVVKEVMDELGLVSFPKTSGSTGMHILAPIKPELEFPVVRDFAKELAKEVEGRVDDQDVATTTWKVADRSGVFVDYGQNARDRTIASAYSIRPTADARASAPLSWEEVPRSDPADFTLETMRDRVAKVGDLTAGMWHRKVSLVSRLERFGLTPTAPSRKRTPRNPVEHTLSGASEPDFVDVLYIPSSDSTVGSPRRRRGRTCAHVHSSGSLSGRKRRKRVPCRKRSPWSLS